MPLLITKETSIDYDVHGQGPPVILIGGLGFGRWAFFKQIPALSRHFSTITFDARQGERDQDRYVPVANAIALAEAIPGAKLRVLDDAGHLIFIERAAEVNREVVTFLKPRRWQIIRTEPALEKLKGRLRGVLQVLGGWSKKLRDRISR